jgi:hypothetical protein
MATVINNPGQSESTGGGTGIVVGAIVLLVVVALFFMYGLPAMRNTNQGSTVNVPDRVQVDVNETSNAQ